MEDGAKRFFDGTHRLRDPSETVERVRPLFPVFGITRIADVTGLDRVGIPVAVVFRPNSRSIAVSQGKGASLDAAIASAVMESIETFHAERIVRPVKYATYEDLRYTHEMAPIDRLPGSRGQAFDRARAILWIEAQRLGREGSAWLPYELVHTNYTRPLPPESGAFLSSSNGLASGNTLAEATTHALCEVIERDAVAIWSQSNQAERARRRIAPGTIENTRLQDLVARFGAADVDVAIWDATSDIGVPAFIVWANERGNRPVLLPRPSVGTGCHPNRDVALSRALTEAAQERLTLITGSRDDLAQEYYGSSAFRDIFAEPGRRAFHAVPTRDFLRSDDDVAWLIERLGAVGLPDAFVVDLTSDLVARSIAVVRVVVPGLESVYDDPRYVPGARARAAVGAAP